MKRSLPLVIGIVVVVVVVAIVVMNRRTTNNSASTNPTPTSTTTANQTTVITYTSGGFSPAVTSVKSGDSVTFENKTNEDIQINSNPHPIHTDDTDLNVGSIGPNQSKTVTLTKKGTFGFHNHLNPGEGAKITIQ